MIFNGKDGLAIYLKYYNDGDPAAITEFIKHADGLCGVNAQKFTHNNMDDYSDYKQIGLIKCYDIIRNKRYHPGTTKATLYTYLTTCLNNAVVDYLRRGYEKSGRDCDLDDGMADFRTLNNGLYKNGDGPEDIEEMILRTQAFTSRRWPSVHPKQAYEAAKHITLMLMDGNKQAHQGLHSKYKTITHAKLFTVSVRSHIGLQLAHKPIHESLALSLIPQYEMSNLPEHVLWSGVMPDRMVADIVAYRST